MIEEFRSHGWSFAYSTNLVGDDLVVLDEPQGGDALDVVRQILEPHGLTIRSEEGLWLIVRSDSATARLGSLLIIVRDRRDYMPLDELQISASPEFDPGILLTQGIQQIPEVIADTYMVTVGAAGYESVEREVRVRPGQNTELKVDLDPARPEIENITVSASRYEISRVISTSQFDIDRSSIETLPDVGNDPLRATHRRSHISGVVRRRKPALFSTARDYSIRSTSGTTRTFLALSIRALSMASKSIQVAFLCSTATV